MTVPFIDLKRQLKPIREAVLKDWETCFDETQFVGGSFVTKLEADMKAALGVPHFVSCANGTDALYIALQALGVKPGAKVALPNLTFWATYEAVVSIGCTPVLVDIDPTDLQMSFDEFVKAHEKYKFEAAFLVHLMGWCSGRLQDFRNYCKDKKIALVEDGAQSFGVEVNGKSVYADAEASTLSFYPAKVIGGAMDGGGMTAKNEDVAKLMRVFCNHGRATHYSYSHVGWNSRMGGLQAAFLSRVLTLSHDMLGSRRKASTLYRKLLNDKLAGKVRMYGAPKGVTENGYLTVLTSEIATGEEIANALKAKGIGAANTYPQTMDAQPPATGALKVSDLKVSRAFCKSVVNLPLFAGITDDEVARSVDALVDVINTLGKGR